MIKKNASSKKGFSFKPLDSDAHFQFLLIERTCFSRSPDFLARKEKKVDTKLNLKYNRYFNFFLRQWRVRFVLRSSLDEFKFGVTIFVLKIARAQSHFCQ